MAPVFRSIPTKLDNAATNLATRFGLHVVMTHSRIAVLVPQSTLSVKRNKKFSYASCRCGAHRRKLRTIFWHVYYFFIGITSISDPFCIFQPFILLHILID